MLITRVLAAVGVVAALAGTATRPNPSIIAVGNTTVPRFSHTATLLKSGKVLVAGGLSRGSEPQATAEIYDPETRRFSPIGSLISRRGYGSTATLLPSGKVLIAGGSCGSGCMLATAEIFDPANQQFRSTGSMSVPRAAAQSVALQNGDVLIMGGDQDANRPPASAEIYREPTGTFVPTGSMNVGRDYFSAVLLKDGKVLVMGGSSTGQHPGMEVQSSTELYDPATGHFVRVGAMTTPRSKCGAALLPNGRVLVVGGQNGGPFGAKLASTEIYDPVTRKFTPGPMMEWARYKLPRGVVALNNGSILIAGGAEQPEVFLRDQNSFETVAGAKLDAYYFSTVTTLANGDVLLVGGYGASPGVGAINHAWIYRPLDEH